MVVGLVSAALPRRLPAHHHRQEPCTLLPTRVVWVEARRPRRFQTNKTPTAVFFSFFFLCPQQKERLLTDLRAELDIGHDQHVALLDRVLADATITRVREATTTGVPLGGTPGPGRGPPGASSRPAPATAPAKKGSKKRPASPSPPAGRARGGASRSASAPRGAPAPRSAPPPRLASTPSGGLRAGGRPTRGTPGGLAAATPSVPGVNPLIGRRVWRHWPDEPREWAEGVITDYRPEDDAHCIVYQFNTPDEQFEWFCLARARDGVDFRMSDAPPIDVLALALPPGAAGTGTGPTPRQPPRLGGGGASRPSARARERDRRRGGRPQSGAPRAVADFAFERAVVPFDKAYFAAKLPVASTTDLATMAAMLAAREREVKAEVACITALTAGGLPPLRELGAKLELIAARERAVKAELKDLDAPPFVAPVAGGEGGDAAAGGDAAPPPPPPPPAAAADAPTPMVVA